LEQEVPGSSCALLVPGLDLATLLRSHGAQIPFRGEWHLETKIWALDVLIACEMLWLPDLFSGHIKGLY